MRRLILSIYTLMLFSLSVVGQEYSLYFMPDVWNSNYMNPGLYPRQNVVVSLPSIHASINAIGLNQANAFRHDSADDVYYFNYSELLDKLNRDVTMKASAGIDAFAVGFRVKKLFLSVSSNTCVEADFTAPQDFFRFVWEGTNDYLNTPLDIGPSFNAMAYQKVGLGGTYMVKPNLSVGLRINRLLGLAGMQTQNSRLAVTQNSEFYQTRFEIDYLVNYYAAGALEPFDQTVEGIVNFEDEIGEFGYEGSTSFSTINNKNNGWGVDLGAEYFYNKRLTFAASVTNLGGINWKNKTQQLRVTEDYTFNGIVIDDISDDAELAIDAISDTLETLLDFEATGNKGFRQRLAPRSYLSARYSPASFVTFGGLLYNEFASYGTFTALSLSSRLSLGRVLSVGGIYTFQVGTHNNFGLNTALKLGPLQIYAIADNIAPLVNPERLDGTNFRLGMNMTFGRKKMDERLAADLELQQFMSDSLAAEAYVVEESLEIKEDKKMLKEAEKEEAALAKAEKDAQRDAEKQLRQEQKAQEEEEAALARAEQKAQRDADKQLQQEEKAREEAKEEDTSLAEAKPKQKSKKEAQPAVAEEAPTMNAAKAVRVFQLETMFKDVMTTGLVDAVYVDIYRIDAEGNNVLVRTGRFANGKLSVLLNTSEDEHQVIASAYGYEPYFFSFVPMPGNEVEADHFMKTVAESVEDVAQQNTDTGQQAEVLGVIPPHEEVEIIPEEAENTPEVEEVVSEEVENTSEVVETQPLMFESTTPETPEPSSDIDTYEVVEEELPAPPIIEEPEANISIQPQLAIQHTFPTYYITQRTSLRSHATSQSDVLRRLAVGTELEILDKHNEWWWYVSLNGQEGYVKAHLLERL